MTIKEREARERRRKALREMGVLPPPKKKLNRKNFVAEALAEAEKEIPNLSFYPCLLDAVQLSLAALRPSPETIGVAKVLKMACEINRYYDELKAQGDTKYKIDDLYQRIKPILEA